MRTQSNWSQGQTSDRDIRDTGQVGDFGIRQSQYLRNVILAQRGMSLRTPKANTNIHAVESLYTSGNLTTLASELAWDEGVLQIVKDATTGEHRIGWIKDSFGIYNGLLENVNENWCIARYNDRAMVSNGNKIYIARKGITGLDVEELVAPPVASVSWSDPGSIIDGSGAYRYGFTFTYRTALTETESVYHSFGVGDLNKREFRTNVPAAASANLKLVINPLDIPGNATHVRIYRTTELNGVNGTPGSPGVYYLVGEVTTSVASTTGAPMMDVPDSTLIAQPITDAPYRLPFPPAQAMRMMASYTVVAQSNIMYYCGSAQAQVAFGYYYPEQMQTFSDDISAFDEAQGWLVTFGNSQTFRQPLTRADDPTTNPYSAIGIDAPLLRDPTLCDGSIGLRYQCRHSLVKLSNGYLMGAFSDGSVRKFNGATYGMSVTEEKVSDDLHPLITAPSALICGHYSNDGVYLLWNANDPLPAWACFLMDESTAWVQLDVWMGETHVPRCRLPEVVGGNSLVATGEPFMAYTSRRHFRGYQFERGSFAFNTSLTSQVNFGAHYGAALGYFARHLESSAFFRRFDANTLAMSITLYDSQDQVLAVKSFVTDSAQVTLNDSYDAMHYYYEAVTFTGSAIELIQLNTTLMVTDRNDDNKIESGSTWSSKPWGSGIAMFGFDGLSATATPGSVSHTGATGSNIVSASWDNGLEAIQHTMAGFYMVEDAFAPAFGRVSSPYVALNSIYSAFCVRWFSGSPMFTTPTLTVHVTSTTTTINGLVFSMALNPGDFVQISGDTSNGFILRKNGTFVSTLPGVVLQNNAPDFTVTALGSAKWHCALYSATPEGVANLGSVGLNSALNSDFRAYIDSI